MPRKHPMGNSRLKEDGSSSEMRLRREFANRDVYFSSTAFYRFIF